MTSLLAEVDLQGYTFDDSTRMTWLQALPIGTYEHPLYGTIKVTAKKIDNMVRHWSERVRGQDLDIDYDHKATDGRAAGWVVAAENRGFGPAGGLWIQVEWTPSAYTALKEGEYRYFSPEFADEWTHPKTQVQYHDVLFGGAITNRPFLKGIMPIQLSELQLGEADQGDASMSEVLKRLAELVGLTDFDPEAQGAEETLLAGVTKLKETKVHGPEPDGDGDGDGDGDDELKQLAEKSPALARLLQEREDDRKALRALEAAHRLSEVSLKLGETKTEKWMLPPAFVDAIRPILVQINRKLSEDAIDAISQLTKSGLVPLNAPAGAGRGEGHETDPVKAFSDKVAEAMKGDSKLSYVDASKAVAASEPEMYAAYEGAVLAGAREEG